MYKILYQWSESCFSFAFLSYWQAERTPNTISTFTAPAGAVFKASFCPLPPPMPVNASGAPALGHVPAEDCLSSEQRQQSHAPDLPVPAERSHGKGTGSPGPLWGECRDSSSAPQGTAPHRCCCAQLQVSGRSPSTQKDAGVYLVSD